MVMAILELEKDAGENSSRASLHHEGLHRGKSVMASLSDFPVTVCGAGAVGANVIESLARQGFDRLRLIDRDRVEERNLSTQPYFTSDVGAFKARIMANSIFRAVGVEVEARPEELTDRNRAKLLRGSPLIVDTFDNSPSRRSLADYARESNTPCLHVGLADGYSEVMWNDLYRVPSPANDDVCDYPLARNLVLLTVAVACESIVRFASTGEQASFTITLGDLRVLPYCSARPKAPLFTRELQEGQNY